jgi:hypothetical protein
MTTLYFLDLTLQRSTCTVCDTMYADAIEFSLKKNFANKHLTDYYAVLV